MLSERIARKVASNRWDIDRLLVLTFTTAAAKNMIVRIENKTYGIDRITGELIPKERLRIVPHATLSVASKNARKH